jgi:hypothetical protein
MNQLPDYYVPRPDYYVPRYAPNGRVRDRLFLLSQHDTVSYLTVYLLLLMLIPSWLVFTPLGGIGTPAVVVSFVIILWYLASWMVERAVPSRSGRPVRLAVLGFALAVLASFVAAMTRDTPEVEFLSAERGLVSVAAWAGVIIVVSQSLTSYHRLDILLRRMVILGSIVAGIGIFEFYSGINLTSYIHIPGFSANVDYSTLLSRDEFNRPSSTATDPIEFGVVMAMLLPFALQQGLDPARSGILRKWLPVAMITFAIPVSVSRSGILGLAVGLIFLVPTWKPRQIGTFWIFFAVGLAAIKFAAKGLLGTLLGYFDLIFGGQDSSITSRTSAISRNWQYIVERPIFGRGFGTFIPQNYSYTDNMYLQMLIGAGIVGLIALIFLFLAGIQCAAIGRRFAHDEARRGIGQAIVASLVVAMVGSATFDSLGFPMFAGLVVLILGVAAAYPGIMVRDQ